MSKKGPKKAVPKWLQDYRDSKPAFVVDENQYGIFTYASSEELVVEQKRADATAYETWKVEVFTSGSLVASVKLLARMAEQAADDVQRHCLCTSALLTAAAALEAFLAEYASTTHPTRCTMEFRRVGVPGKYRILTGNSLKADFPDVDKLWECRNAISHSEPENDCSRVVGEELTALGARWVATTVGTFVQQLLGEHIPAWFRVPREW